MMKNYLNTFTSAVSYFFILLFIYASISKILDFENFQVQIAQSPVLTAYAGFVSYTVIIFEIMIAAFLYFSNTRPIGLFCSCTIMSAFTVYIYVILNYSEFVPCSCGGILEKLGWKEHLIFNIVCLIAAALAFITLRKQNAHQSKTSILMLVVSNAFVVLLVGGLFLSSEYLIKNENNFTRRFLPHPIYDEKVIDLKSNTFYFAGNTGDSLFLGNRKAPLIMATVYPKFLHAQIDTLSLDNYKYPFQIVDLNVTYPFFSLSDGTVPVLFEGKFPDRKAVKVTTALPFYSKIKIVTPSNYLLKTTLAASKENVLGIFNSDTGKIKLNASILEKQIDGMFDTDGDLVIEQAKKKMIYTYFYRNQYIITDMELEHKEFGHTIDTVSKAKLELKDLSTGQRKMQAPPLEVNQMQTVYNNQLFNVAKLRGKYESRASWKEANIIDVYDYQSKSYRYSFYVYYYEGHKIRDLLLTKDYLYILAGDKLIKHKRRIKA